MRVHLVDGTYELFRHHYAIPAAARGDGEPVAATRGVVRSVLSMLEQGATHVGVATDHVIESFRNDMWPGYKDGSGLPEDLVAQFPLVEEALEAMGVKVWPMEELEADDAMASAAVVAAADERVEQVLVCTPDKDLAQCVVGDRIVQVDRRRETTLDEDGVVARYGVAPRSIPDWLALVGDSADGYPGLPQWGKASAAVVLRRYVHIEHVPLLAERWEVDVRGARTLAATLAANRDLALLFRELATLRVDRSLLEHVDDLAWAGPTGRFAGMCERLRAADLPGRAEALAVARSRPA